MLRIFYIYILSLLNLSIFTVHPRKTLIIIFDCSCTRVIKDLIISYYYTDICRFGRPRGSHIS